MFNCVYEDGSVISTEDIGECVEVHPVTGAFLIDISELSTTVDVTTTQPVDAGWVVLGVAALLLIGSGMGKKGRGSNARELLL